jgi:hypothetical protein
MRRILAADSLPAFSSRNSMKVLRVYVFSAEAPPVGLLGAGAALEATGTTLVGVAAGATMVGSAATEDAAGAGAGLPPSDLTHCV